ncbi:4-galactosyl-N-acetylglucosaminide 3-alpha-L-fucosyltransferase 9-like [Puntigrus tetrazona]|uniref:4-galactosyl-N-acetylglucosaminide 3-alpha-L-fucosyltransferase 9-like n=1 Tax=Puntigrus tetrazona TaxID=1606681 RepID=UPI001C890136|nr:4-galactosyl-N-acetylglucosaminide 3-alpha-L-fucosyltransferase 9-like [Puntigrus tetrazona]XP_043103489.1 4-galactosyl-N-acetylglucosaminide 3-alpha-L-fucosyltransferase 9-like [Puntigrus tetrazona]XP_043103490.1 4-galactosyl-N-acetylglucosaminide 3-alpha-L-fucosyltransferase 9-like [Puntigrus tetrazona]
MSNANGTSLLRLGVILLMAGVISLSVVFFWFSLSNNCPSPVFRPDRYSQIIADKSSRPLANKAEGKPLVLLWVWPQDYRFEFSDCKRFFNIDNCQLTDDRSLYNDADDVIVYHRNISKDLSNLPPSPRPPFQRWIWLHLESPTNTKIIPGLENLFNLTLSYRQDADIPVRMRLITSKEPNKDFVIPKKDKLVCWIVSNNNSTTGVDRRNDFFKEFSKYIQVTLFGKAYARFLNYTDYYPTLASCKFYLALENSVHKDYFMEKINGPLAAGTVPVVLGPPRRNYENYYPAESFIHVDDFPDERSLAMYLLQLDRDENAYHQYFNWRKHLTPSPHLILQTQEFILAICTACDHVARHREYKEVHDLYDWYFR